MAALHRIKVPERIYKAIVALKDDRLNKFVTPEEYLAKFKDLVFPYMNSPPGPYDKTEIFMDRPPQQSVKVDLH